MAETRTSIPVDIGALPTHKLGQLLGLKARTDPRPYYNETYGYVAMEIAQKAIKGEPQPLHDDGCAANTIRQRFYQGMAYAADKGWTNAAKFKDAVRVQRIFGRHTVVRKYNPDPTDKTWREDLTRFLETSLVGESFTRINMTFTASDIEWIEQISRQELIATEFDFSFSDHNLTVQHHKTNG